jgi:hypothetical protein
MLPDMSGTLLAWQQPVKRKIATTTTVDFVKQTVLSESPIEGVVQVADKEKLNPDIVDWSLEYILLHTNSAIDVGQFIEHKTKNFKIIDLGDYIDYGYYRAVCEEVKGSLS